MKKIFSFLSVAALICCSTMLNAQQSYHRCSSAEHLNAQFAEDPQLAQRMHDIETQTQNFIASGDQNSRAVVTIPVVVHVVYANSTQNISDALIQAQINQLNADYAHLNSDAGNTPSVFSGLAANCNVQFCLAQRDPAGAATTGIVRKSTTVASFTDNDAVKKSTTGGDNAWDATKYLNLWSCNLGGGLLGYAQFPGGSASTDGVVVLYSSVGSLATPGTASPYNFGRTATHEVGHWLNLYHIWGDDGTACTGSDQVGDTPNQADENYGCPTYPNVSCSNGPNGDMFMNYMDYTDDACMNMFTSGQSARMAALFTSGGSRVGLVTSLGCQAPAAACALATALSTTSITNTTATFNWTAAAGAVSYSIQYRVVGTTTWSTGSSSTTSYAATGLTLGTNYEWQVKTNCSAGSSAFSASATFTTTGSAPCNTPASATTSSITSSTATFNWAAVTGAVSYSIQYRIVGAATWSTGSSSTTSYAASGLTAASNYEWQVSTVCTAGSSAFTGSATFTTAAASTCSDIYESNNTSSTAKVPSLNTNLTGFITPSTDVDYFKFTTTSAAKNVRIDLTNLPADYDVKLYRTSTSTTVGTGQNSGTTAELIKYNTSGTYTYYVKVYGYNGATSATSCYTLKISTSSTAFRTANDESSDLVTEAVVAEPVLKLYPNPAADNVTIEYLNATAGRVTMNVYNLSGQKVLSTEATAEEGLNKQNLNTNTLNNGVYVFEINSNGETQRQKFTISK